MQLKSRRPSKWSIMAGLASLNMHEWPSRIRWGPFSGLLLLIDKPWNLLDDLDHTVPLEFRPENSTIHGYLPITSG